MAKFIGTKEQFGGRGYCFLEFVPSEEVVIDSLNENGRCLVSYHLLEGTIVKEEWNNSESGITGPKLYNDLRNKGFVKVHHNRIEKIVLNEIG